MTVRALMGAVLALVLLTPSLASALPRAGVNARQATQGARIARAARAGTLTPIERRRLAATQSAIRAKERVYRRSGRGLSRWERADLQRDLNRAGRQIGRATR